MIPLFVNYNKKIKERVFNLFNLFNLFRIDFQPRTQRLFG